MDPITRFQEVLARAEECEPDVPSAVTLATIDAYGRPTARVVLLRGVDERGFVFHTNYNSKKGRELDAYPHAALCFHWKTLAEQVRVEGIVERISAEESDAYFASRPQQSQLAAIASKQSSPLDDRATLEKRYADLVAEHGANPIPRPDYWGGFRVAPNMIEFWKHGEHRLHHRERFNKIPDGWKSTLLYP